MRLPCGEFELRPFQDPDAESLARHADDPDIARQMRNRFPSPYTLRDAEDWIQMAKSTAGLRMLAFDHEGEAVGGIGLHLQDDVHRHCAELGYWIGRAYWGRGWTTRAVVAMTRHAFDDLELHRVYAHVFSSNPASRRVLQKAGFQQEGVLRRSVLKNGVELDQWLFAALSGEWRAPNDATP